MTLLAVMAMYRVTRGAGQRVPISGATGRLLTGQVVLAGSLSTGAAKSEPHRGPGRRAADGDGVYGMVAGAGGVPGVAGAGSVPEARTTWAGTSAYMGPLLRPG